MTQNLTGSFVLERNKIDYRVDERTTARTPALAEFRQNHASPILRLTEFPLIQDLADDIFEAMAVVAGRRRAASAVAV